jgi:hypothetical protein
MIKRALRRLKQHSLPYPADWLQAKEFQLNTNPIVRLGFVTEAQGDDLKAG